MSETKIVVPIEDDEMSSMEFFCPFECAELAFNKMLTMQKEDANCIPAEIESVIVSVADYYGLMD